MFVFKRQFSYHIDSLSSDFISYLPLIEFLDQWILQVQGNKFGFLFFLEHI